MKKETSAMVSAVMGNVLLGLAFIFSKLGQRYAEPFVLVAWRLIIAVGGMTVFALLTGRRITVKGRRMAPIIFTGICDPLLYFVFESYGIKLTNASFSGIMIAVIPVCTIVASAIFLKEKANLRQWIFTVISIAAVAAISFHQKAAGNVTLAGVLMLIGAVLASAAFAVTSRKLSGDFTPFERSYFAFCVALVGFILLAVFTNLKTPENLIAPCKEPGFWVSTAFLGVCASAMAYTFAHYANTYVPLNRTASFANLATVVSVAAGVLFLHESIDTFTVICAIIVLVCSYFAQLA